MVLTTDNKFSEIYDIIKNDSLHGESVLILVARDCDSISACKIFTEILKSDSISYNIKPVSGLEDLEKVDESLLENEEIKSIIMINCGGNLDISSIFTNLTQEQVVYIIDSHRPYSLENINNTHNALIIDDGTYDTDNQLNQDNSDDSDDSDEYYDEDDDNEEDEDGDEVKEDEEDEEIEDDNDDDEYDNEDIKKENKKKENLEENQIDENNKKKKNKSKKRKNRKNKKNKKRKQRNNRVEKSYYGKSCSILMYKISTILQKQNLNDLLWYSVLGLTDQLVHERITLESYEEQYKEFKQLILNEYNNNNNNNNEEFNEFSEENKLSNMVGDKIIPSDDFRFMLYRHWNLYESLYNSRFVACKLRIWKSKGKFLLDSLFAMMGIPLDQVKQKYVNMNIHYKKSLKQLLAINGPKFGLINLYFNSFLKKYQCNSEISASDTVYAVTALMESDNLEVDQTDEEIWEQNFWEAYDSISSKNIDLLKIGLKQSIELQKEITRQVASMIEKRSVILSGPFRYSFITESSELKYFIHPLALTKLGLFMMDAFIAMGKIRKPFLIGSLNEKKQTYLIVGISGSHSSDIQSNQFGAHFRKSAEYTNAILKYQSFDTSIIEISKSDLHKFVEHLHSSLI